MLSVMVKFYDMVLVGHLVIIIMVNNKRSVDFIVVIFVDVTYNYRSTKKLKIFTFLWGIVGSAFSICLFHAIYN